MKKLMTIAFVVLLSVGMASAQTQKKTEKKEVVETALKFTTKTVDLGKIKYRKPATATFEFVNAGKKPVIITYVRTSCGCTSKKYPKEPIKPGEKSKIQATYNATGSGTVTKTVTVKTNEGARPTILTLRATVIKEAPKKPATK